MANGNNTFQDPTNKKTDIADEATGKIAVGQFNLETLLLGKLVDDDGDGFIFREIMDLKGGNKFGMCNLSQSINSPCMSLVISIIDSSNALEKMGTRGVQGEEWVYLKLSIGEENVIKLLFCVTAIGPVTLLPDSKGHTFDLICQTKEKIISDIVTVNKSYHSNISDTAKNIYVSDVCNSDSYKNLSTAKVDEENPIWEKRPFFNHATTDTEKFIIPGLQPFSAMNWLAVKAYGGAKSPSSYYTFFENNKGFHFASIEQLIRENKDNGPTYTYTPLQSATPKNDVSFYRNIKQLGPISIKSSSARLNDGTYTHNVRTVDVIKKNHRDRYFSMNEQFNIFEGTGKLFNNTKKYFDTFGEIDPFEYTTVTDSTNPNFSEETIGKRLAYLNLISTYSTTATVYGDISLNAGDVVTIDLPSATMEEDEKGLSMYKGYWFVSAVTHVFDHAQMNTNLSLQKSGIEKVK